MNGPEFPPDMRVMDARWRLIRALRAAGIDGHERLATHLLHHALKLDFGTLLLSMHNPVGEAGVLLADVARRALSHEPLARIIGTSEFYGLTLALNEATLDPRPETEGLVHDLLRYLREIALLPRRILDIGTGSGAILLALLSTLPEAEGTGWDIAPRALAAATANAAANGLSGRVHFHRHDVMGVAPEGAGYDLIVSNPPYIPSADLAGLEPAVRDFDPPVALDGGADGLAFYRRLAQLAPGLLEPAGVLAVEIGFGQAEAVQTLFVEAGLAEILVKPDLAGISRLVLARKAAPATLEALASNPSSS